MAVNFLGIILFKAKKFQSHTNCLHFPSVKGSLKKLSNKNNLGKPFCFGTNI